MRFLIDIKQQIKYIQPAVLKKQVEAPVKGKG